MRKNCYSNLTKYNGGEGRGVEEISAVKRDSKSDKILLTSIKKKGEIGNT
jgi:hypothetical protein